MGYHFDEENTPTKTLVSNIKNTRPCPFSGRYSLTGSHSALTGLLDISRDEGGCHSVSFFMQAGCSESSDLHVESTCHPRPLRDPGSRNQMQNDAPINTRNEFTCHGQWASTSPTEDGAGTKQLLLLSSGPTLQQKDNSLSREFMCLEFSDSDGIMSASVASGSCYQQQKSDRGLLNLGDAPEKDLFNITSSGPCLQALTGGGESIRVNKSHSAAVVVFVISAVLAVFR